MSRTAADIEREFMDTYLPTPAPGQSPFKWMSPLFTIEPEVAALAAKGIGTCTVGQAPAPLLTAESLRKTRAALAAALAPVQAEIAEAMVNAHLSGTSIGRVHFLHSEDYEDLRAPASSTDERVGKILFPGEVRTWGEIRFVTIPPLAACLPRPRTATEAPNAPERHERPQG